MGGFYEPRRPPYLRPQIGDVISQSRETAQGLAEGPELGIIRDLLLAVISLVLRRRQGGGRQADRLGDTALLATGLQAKGCRASATVREQP